MTKGGATRKVSVPGRLKGKTDPQIKEWAREELYGQEALLDRDTLSKIKRGEMKEVLLRTKKSGFFLPGTNQFIEASDMSVGFGEDLDEVEKEMEKEEEDWAWVDRENKAFNQDTVPESAPGRFAMRQHWEHGKRVYEYVEASKRSLRKIHELLAKRGGPKAYGVMTHETASSLYAWKPDATPEDPVFDWTWHVLDAVLRFSSENSMREYVAELINTDLLPSNAPQQSLSDFLRGLNDKKPIWRKDAVFLSEMWSKLKRGEKLTGEERDRLKQQFELLRH